MPALITKHNTVAINDTDVIMSRVYKTKPVTKEQTDNSMKTISQIDAEIASLDRENEDSHNDHAIEVLLHERECLLKAPVQTINKYHADMLKAIILSILNAVSSNNYLKAAKQAARLAMLANKLGIKLSEVLTNNVLKVINNALNACFNALPHCSLRSTVLKVQSYYAFNVSYFDVIKGCSIH